MTDHDVLSIDLERLVADKNISIQSEAKLPLLEETGIRLRMLAVCKGNGLAREASIPYPVHE